MDKHEAEEILTESQMEIMRSVWALNSCGSGKIIKSVNKDREKRELDPLSRTTIQTQLDRLTKKGWIKKTMNGGRCLYESSQESDTQQEQLATRFTKGLFDSPLSGLVRCFLGRSSVKEEEVAELQKIIDDMKKS